MKTTLKRGVGRSAETNGNGRAVQPPGALTPITRYHQPAKRRGVVGILGRILLFLVLATISLLVGVGGGYWLEGEQTVVEIDRISRSDPNVRKAADKLNVPLPNRPTIALVVGQDTRRWASEEDFGDANGTAPLREAGIFTAETNGVMYNRVVFDPVTKTNAFKLTLLWDIVF